MADNRAPLTDEQVENMLRQIGREIDYPPTPMFASRVRDRLAVVEIRRPWFWMPAGIPRGLAVALVLLVLAGGSLLAVWPNARIAVADRLGLRGIDISFVPFVPAATPTTQSMPTPLPVGERLGLGTSMTLDEAGVRLRFAIPRPTLPEIGLPDEVYVVNEPSGGRVSLVYAARAGIPATTTTGVGLLLVAFQGNLEPTFFGKGLGPDTRIEVISINGGQGFWIEGQPHMYFYRDTGGQVRDETVRLAGNVLLWDQNGLTLRLESALAKDEAIRIASSVR